LVAKETTNYPMNTTREMLLARRRELLDSLPALAQRFRNLREEILQCESQVQQLQNELSAIDEALKKLADPGPRPAPTIMEAVLEVLNHKPNGMTALEILDEINAKYFDGAIVRTSLSPQLSRLKDRDGKIELRGNRWYRVPKEPTLFTDRRS
jgi:DNA repair exonuclease SbcCD ATPase subunit